MTTFRATNLATCETTEYEAATPQQEHLEVGWRLESVSPCYVAPDAPQDTRLFGGRRKLTKLELIALLGDDFIAIMAAAKQSVQVEAFVELVRMATPGADLYSIDLDDSRFQALHQLEAMGVIGVGRAETVLNG